MRAQPIVLLLFLALPNQVAAQFEIFFGFGNTYPTYEQSFRYDPGSALPDIPGVNIESEGAFQLDAGGGLAINLGGAYFFNDFLGIEGRLDLAEVDLQVVGPRFNATVELPAPFPDLSSDLDLTAGEVDIERLQLYSLNLKGRTRGRVRLAASGGLSFLPNLSLAVTQTIGLGLRGIEGLPFGFFLPELPALDVAEFPIRAELGLDDGESRLGYNAGVGVEVQVAPRVAVAGEARLFKFQKRTLRWRALAGFESRIEEELFRQLERSLDPVEFEPIFFQATASVVVSF